MLIDGIILNKTNQMDQKVGAQTRTAEGSRKSGSGGFSRLNTGILDSPKTINLPHLPVVKELKVDI